MLCKFWRTSNLLSRCEMSARAPVAVSLALIWNTSHWLIYIIMDFFICCFLPLCPPDCTSSNFLGPHSAWPMMVVVSDWPDKCQIQNFFHGMSDFFPCNRRWKSYILQSFYQWCQNLRPLSQVSQVNASVPWCRSPRFASSSSTKMKDKQTNNRNKTFLCVCVWLSVINLILV